MTYQLGIDFGTTSVAAAIRRTGAQAAEVVPLGGGGATVPPRRTISAGAPGRWIAAATVVVPKSMPSW